MVRELDSLGRIVLPVELRRRLDIEVSDGLEIFKDGELIILRKYSPGCIFCGNVMNDTVYFKGKIVCRECMNNSKVDS
ncbi:AbrB/MazE/SpoVT family DNA-binding domain-containing protein [Brevibacillus sp. AY1]|nr:AbrB/MazE/SpoVT family DNA-binding domain-containing protein [Brevibacillus sp. AY1]